MGTDSQCVADIMTENVVTVRPETNVVEAMELLDELHARHLPVVRGRHLVGIISDRDLRDYVLPPSEEFDHPDQARRMSEIQVGEIMAENVVTASPGDGLGELVDLMLSTRVGAICVVESGSDQLAGIVSYVDVLRAVRPGL
jgi:acetoin utilization protein AcuB